MAMNQFGAGFVFDAADNASPVFDKVGKKFGGLKGVVSKAAQGIKMGMRQASMAVAALGGGLIAGGLKIGRGFDDSIKAASDFGAAIGEVSTLVDEAVFPMERMRKITQEMAVAFGQEAALEAKALYQIISSGTTDVAKATEILRAANLLAVGGVTDVATAVNGLTNIMNAYSSANLKATDVSDAMFVAIRAGKTTAEELARAIGRVAPSAEALEIPFDQLLASISAITTKGISTRETISGLKAALANIVKPTSDAVKEAKRLGITFDAGALRAKKLSGFMDSITKSSKYNKDSISKLFGSIEAFNAMTALASDGSKKFNQILGEMGDRVGSTDKAFSKIAKTYDFQQKRLKQLREGFKITFGESLLRFKAPILKYVNEFLEKALNFFRAMPPEARDTLVGIAAAVGKLAVGAGGVLLLVGAMGLLGISLSGLVVGLGAVLLLAGPLLVMFSGLAVGVYAAYQGFRKNAGGISGTWKETVANLKLGLRAAIDLFRSGELSDAVKRDLDKAGAPVKSFVVGFERFLDRWREFWAGLKQGFAEGVEALDFGGLKQRFEGLLSFFQEDADPMKNWKESGRSAGLKLAEFGQSAIGMMEKIIDFGGKVANAIKNITGEDIKQGIKSFNEAFETTKTVLKGIAWLVNDIIKGIKILAGAWDVIKAGPFGAFSPRAKKTAQEQGGSFGLTGDVEELRKKATSSRDWLANVPAAQEASKAAGLLTVEDASIEMKKDVKQQLAVMNAALLRLGERPVNITVKTPDNKVLYEGVKNAEKDEQDSAFAL